MRCMPNVTRPDRRPGRDLREQLRQLLALLPLALDLPDRPVRAQPRRAGRTTAADGGFDTLDSTNTLPVWLQRAGYYTGLIGKYLNGYEAHEPSPQPVPRRVERVARHRPDDLQLLRLRAERGRHPVHLRRRQPQDYSTDVYTAEGGRLHQSPGAIRRSRSSSGSPTSRRTAAARTRARQPRATATTPPSRRRATLRAFDSTPLPQPPVVQRGGRLRQAGADPQTAPC